MFIRDWKNGDPCFVVMKYLLKLLSALICKAHNLPNECLALGVETVIQNVGTVCQSLFITFDKLLQGSAEVRKELAIVKRV